MRHFASPSFWKRFDELPTPVQDLAKKNFQLLKRDSLHPSLHFKSVGRFRSVRVGISFRALGVSVEDGVVWFWIGDHGEFEKLIRQ